MEAGGNFTLSDTQVTGRGTDTLVSIEEASLTGNGSANTLDAGGFSGSTTLDGAGGDDTLVGGYGNDSAVGGTGNNLFVETAALTTSVQFTLTNQSLVGLGTDVLSNTFRRQPHRRLGQRSVRCVGLYRHVHAGGRPGQRHLPGRPGGRLHGWRRRH